MVSTCWPNTIQLTLSILHSSELVLLLQRNALPTIEHLSVTNEDISVALLLGSLAMPLLEKLILIDLYNHSKLPCNISLSIILVLYQLKPFSFFCYDRPNDRINFWHENLY
ncbi:unnamed protein product [Rotaria socialis]|nr:unnamed protein product [Rotaria socialis]CAF3358110.1 unnamed protein product [Rotaria socialis]CAF3412921.1 unnamed protein product [Rotaria socialis]CAF3570874.1 unnamed protein product [Rotaria socialis]CAF4394671.1 unnamed protein product [Rotaria socialis]